ncbi:AGE family epimerase/isomerase [Maricaulis maris]|uniref:AGE family epimerase/isomerase n=1 Tax=Maricaulis maris TaxID=74318 RepID=UPI00292651C9|nr:mannose-6-phosphate isomerase [Maricaulis maris]
MNSVQRYADWCRHIALPYWAEHAWDRRSGGFLEALSLDGRPVTGDSRRVRTQARQVYVFARAHIAGWCDSADLAIDGYELLEQRAKAPDGSGGWVHRLTDSGGVEDSTRDLYDHTFILLALAWLYRLTHDPRYRREAEAILAFLDADLRHVHGGYAESVGAPTLTRRQNPHMHFFECMLAWHAVTGDRMWLDRASEVLGLLVTRFIDSASGCLMEFFDDQWRPDPSTVGDVVEPGHEMEWVWLLDSYQRAGGPVPDQIAKRLYHHAQMFGVNPATGFMMSAISRDGRALQGGSRTWVQTEWLRAALARYRQGSSANLSEAETAAAELLRWHVDPAGTGGWIDHVDEIGHRAVDRIPASTLYHLFGAALDAADATRES